MVANLDSSSNCCLNGIVSKKSKRKIKTKNVLILNYLLVSISYIGILVFNIYYIALKFVDKISNIHMDVVLMKFVCVTFNCIICTTKLLSFRFSFMVFSRRTVERVIIVILTIIISLTSNL